MRDLNRAAALFDEACQKGDLAGCSAHAAMLDSGETIGRDLARARARYRKTCDGGVPADCHALAKTLSTLPADRKAAFELNSKACAGGVAAACHEVAVAWEAGREPLKALPFCGLGYLSRREHSRAELARKLAPHGEADEIDALLDDLERRGQLSDARFAESLTHARAGKYGSRRLAHELREKGVGEALVADAVSDARADDLAAARVVWQKKFGAPPADPKWTRPVSTAFC